ncbi:hypothetical protein SESBI_45150 [Sesbania bispinosa]|nr:hypothetical protein SESBI_45150 [Sesbania bispinosa]
MTFFFSSSCTVVVQVSGGGHGEETTAAVATETGRKDGGSKHPVNGVVISREEDLHGEWITINKIKKTVKNPVKGGTNIESDSDLNKGKVDSTKHAKNQGAEVNRFSSLNVKSSATQVSAGPIEINTFSSLPLTQKIWTRRKRQRAEPTFIQPKIFSNDFYKPILDAVNKAPVENNKVDKGRKESSSDQATTATSNSSAHDNKVIRTLPGNIKTTLDVVMVSPNHLRFVDEPKPPDPEHMNDPSSAHVEVGNHDDGYEMDEAAPTHLSLEVVDNSVNMDT